jgi:hypothetical protein
MTRTGFVALLAFILLVPALQGAEKEDGWVKIFDGKSMKGWKANENTKSWTVADGALVCHGPRSHLFYVGDDKPFKNFEFKADVMTTPGSNAGIYIHTRYQESGWPKHGYEAQVNNTHGDPKKTASLYGVVNVLKAPAKDGEWFTQHIIVRGKQIIIKINGKTLVDYTEPKDKKPGKNFTRVLTEGTFAFQAHDPKSKVFFKNVMVKRLD